MSESNLWSYDKNTQSVNFKYGDEILSEYQTLFQSVFPDLNLDASTPQGQLITSLAQGDLIIIDYLQSLANGFFFGGSGFFLDLWAWNSFRVTRKAGVKSQVYIEINGVAGSSVNAGFQVGDGTHTYTISSATIINADGSVNALFIADELDDFQAEANTITEIVTPSLGIERVNNPAQATAPTLKETDTELFQRCLKYGSIALSGTFESVMANVAQVNGVSKTNGGENFTGLAKVINGVELPAHSICVVVKGGTDENIAKAMASVRPTGCDMLGDVSYNISSDGVLYTYNFYRPIAVNLAVSVQVNSANIKDANYIESVKTAVTSTIEAYSIGELITQAKLAQDVRNKIKLFDIVDLKFNKKGSALGYNPLQLKLNEEAYIAAADIGVTTL